MYDQEKKKSRGFGFLSFETEDAVDRCVMEHFVTVNGKQVNIISCQRHVGSDSKSGGDKNTFVRIWFFRWKLNGLKCATRALRMDNGVRISW